MTDDELDDFILRVLCALCWETIRRADLMDFLRALGYRISYGRLNVRLTQLAESHLIWLNRARRGRLCITYLARVRLGWRYDLMS